MMLDGKRVVVTGGTGSLGKCLVRRLLANELGKPFSVTVFSRDEDKQHAMRLESRNWPLRSTDEVIYSDLRGRLQFVVGDVRDYEAVASVLQGADVVIHAAAMKQVPTCEYNPEETIKTNILGPANIVRAIRSVAPGISTVVGVSSDKAVKPVNVYGMTKALMERLFLRANLGDPLTRFVCVRYGNVLASRGSVIPLWQEQIRSGGPVTVTDMNMTRFFFTIDQAVDTVFCALKEALPGEVYVPRLPAVNMLTLAKAMIGTRPMDIHETGVRPGEKRHEILISEEESERIGLRDDHFVIQPILPEIRNSIRLEAWTQVGEYSSADNLLSRRAVQQLLAENGLLVEEAAP